MKASSHYGTRIAPSCQIPYDKTTFYGGLYTKGDRDCNEGILEALANAEEADVQVQGNHFFNEKISGFRDIKNKISGFRDLK